MKLFFCQIDKEYHPVTNDRYLCLDCDRFLCLQCYTSQQSVGLNRCPSCGGKFRFVQGRTHSTLKPKLKPKSKSQSKLDYKVVGFPVDKPLR
ncbi:MAG: hypothetical protein ACFFAU_12180 [Candidatus Hodarchaeota archaeon]